jgi:hypothetical protein
MGTWGTGLYSDDLASDLKGNIRELIGDGLTMEVAVDRLLADYKSSLDDPDEATVVWLAIADAAWRLGRPHAQATAEALRIIEEGGDLRRWPSAKDRAKRGAVLAELGVRLRSQASAPKRVPKVFKANNLWTVGEIVSFRCRRARIQRCVSSGITLIRAASTPSASHWIGSASMPKCPMT